MNKQVFRLYVYSIMWVVMVTALPAFGGNCTLNRMYKDEKNILRHFSTESFGKDVSANSSSCSTACKSSALSISNSDMQVLVLKKVTTNATVRCMYMGDEGGFASKSKILSESTVPTIKMTMKSPSSTTDAAAPHRAPVLYRSSAPTANRPVNNNASQSPVVRNKNMRDASTLPSPSRSMQNTQQTQTAPASSQRQVNSPNQQRTAPLMNPPADTQHFYGARSPHEPLVIDPYILQSKGQNLSSPSSSYTNSRYNNQVRKLHGNQSPRSSIPNVKQR